MVLVSTVHGPAGLAATHVADQLAALGQRIGAANTPGNLDGLFACHILETTWIPSLDWQVSPVTRHWLEQNTDRQANAPQLAALGYSLTHFSTDNASNEARTRLAAGLRQLMRRDPYPADGVTFPRDPRQLLGIALATSVIHDDLPEASSWLQQVVDDSRFRPGTIRNDLIRQHVRCTLTSSTPPVTDIADVHDPACLALIYWMTVTSTGRLSDPDTSMLVLQRSILSGLLSTSTGSLPVPDAALLRAAAGHILETAVDSAMLSRDHVGVVLRRFTPAMKRWRNDDPTKVQAPVQWPVNSEREVQDIVWMLLRAVFDDVVDEEPLRKVGHSSYISDFGLPRLSTLVEVKYARTALDFKKIEKEIFQDSVGYAKDKRTYQHIVVFIYDASSSVQEHDTTIAALLGVENITDVIIVSRPSQLPAPDTGKPAPTARRRRPAVQG
jgi:hypothetical protein